MKTLIYLASAFFLLQSCNNSTVVEDYSKEVDAGKFDGTNYSCEELGWSMNFPKQIIITTKESLISADERSKDLSETSKNTSSLKRLLAFQYNMENSFQSTMEKYEGTEADFEKRVKDIHVMIYDNYLNQRTGIDSLGTEVTISGQKLQRYAIKLYDKNGKQTSSQLLYNGLINGYFTSFIMSFTNDEFGMEMEKLFRKSEFK
ncbi:MAG: hypothetical protein ACK476_03410 [Fluviicola sp.]|jgi:hypothetical protein